MCRGIRDAIRIPKPERTSGQIDCTGGCMRRTSVLLSAANCAGIACDSPAAIGNNAVVERFALNESAARAFDGALHDVRLRVLPGLSGVDAENALVPSIDALASVIEARDELRNSSPVTATPEPTTIPLV